MVLDWKERLIAAIDADKRSDRAISREAGLGPNFVNQMRQGRMPTVDNFLALAEVLNLSPVYILTGVEMTAQGEELLRVAGRLSDGGKDRLLQLFRELQDIERT